MGFWNQVSLLMWKNLLIQRRQICVSIFNVLLPVVFIGFIIFFRTRQKPFKYPYVQYYKEEVVVTYPDYFPDNGFIGYTPASKAAEDVMKHVLQLLMRFMPTGKNLSLKGFASEEDSVTYYRNDSDHMQHIIVFHGVSSTSNQMPKKVSFSIRPHLPEDYWYTGRMFNFSLQSRPRERLSSYSDRAVLYLQCLVGEALGKYWIAKGGGNRNSVGFELYTKMFPFPPYSEDGLPEPLKIILPFFITASFLLSVITFTSNVVTEKEKKLKESMKLMGLTSTAYWTSWYLTFSLYLVPAMALYTLTLTLPIVSNGPVLYYSSVSLVFVLLLIYAHAMITFCLMISTLVKKATTGAVASGVLFFLFYCPHPFFIVNYDTISRRNKMRYSLLLNTGMGLATSVLCAYEASGEGATWGNFYQRSQDDYSISILDCMIMMLVSSIIHLLITWYLENVRPGEFGVPKSFTFCLMKSYWFGAGHNKEGSFMFDVPQSKYFEEDPTGRVAGIRICNLRKVFRRRVAVAGTSLNMYEGQITVLLGHNGAGKTTTMAMITGFIPPTNGTAVVNGYDIRKNMNDVRPSLGLCLQHDVLFDKITVSEHLRFFAKMKGYSSPRLNEEIREMATKVGLQDKLNTFSKYLSGVERRMLSVGIALIGDSPIVILDEPTSGMDPDVRRHLWSLLQEARQGRTIMLTTHNIDDAHLLGDRVAIMASGVIKCCGTPLYLKKLCGAVNHLIVEIKPGCDISTLTATIQSVIPKASLETVINTEVTYLLPDQESSKCASLFELLDTEKARLLISSFGTKQPTMEEVLLKAGGSSQDIDLTARNVNTNMFSSTPTGDDLYLTVTKKSEGDVAKITATIRCFFPTVEPTNISGQTVTYLRPEYDSDTLSALCNKLENSKDALKIFNFSTSPQTHVSDVDDLPADTSLTYISNAQTDSVIASDFNTGFSKKKGMSLELSRITGVFVKKALLSLRSRKTILVQLVLPFLFTLIIVLFERRPNPPEPPLALNIVPYGETYIPYTDGKIQSNKHRAISDLYKSQFCSCHNMEYVKLQQVDTFDECMGRKVAKMSKSEYIRKMIIGMEVIETSTNAVAVIAYFNNHPIHSEAISVNYVVNTMLQFTLNSSFSIKSTISPLPQVKENKKDDNDDTDYKYEDNGVACGIFIAFAMSFTNALFIPY